MLSAHKRSTAAKIRPSDRGKLFEVSMQREDFNYWSILIWSSLVGGAARLADQSWKTTLFIKNTDVRTIVENRSAAAEGNQCIAV